MKRMRRKQIAGLLLCVFCLFENIITASAEETGQITEAAAEETAEWKEEGSTAEEAEGIEGVGTEDAKTEDTGTDMAAEYVMLTAAGSTMTQRDGIIRWYSSGTGSANYKNTWKWRVVGWQFSFYRNSSRILDYYYDTLAGSDNAGTTCYTLILDEVVAETGADLKSGDISCIANARIEFRHFNSQSVVDRNLYVDNEADAAYYWRYFGMKPGTGQYGQNCRWESFYLEVSAGEGIAATTGSGWYNYGTIAAYSGTCAPGYFHPTAGTVVMNGNKKVTVTASKQYYITYEGNGATGGSMERQAVIYGDWAVLNKNAYTKQYALTYDAAGGTAEVTAQKADCIFMGWRDYNDFTENQTVYHWYTFDAPFYANYNIDVRNIYGYNKEALLTHFIRYTVNGSEMRRSSGLFSLSSYMLNGGSDLKRIFGSDRSKYIRHWNDSGYRENRNGGSMIDPDAYNRYPDGARVKNLTNKAGASVTLTAEWNNPTVTLPSAERDGYELLGWSRKDGAEEAEYTAGEKVTIDRNTEFYAVWKRQRFNVAYIGNEQDSGNDFTEYGLEQNMDYRISDNLYEGEPHFAKEAVVFFSDSLSGKKIKENTTKTLAGWSFYDDNSQSGMYKTGQVLSGEALCKAAKEAGNVTMGVPAEAYGTYPIGSSGGGEARPSDAAGLYVNLYAVWDCGAVIEAYDRYYTLEEAQRGEITMDELLSHARAWDKEAVTVLNPEGSLAYGEDSAAGTIFTIEGYDAAELRSFAHEGSVTETYLVIDRAGNITRKQITVHIIDSAPYSEGFSDIRFISREYMNTLKEHSIWQTNEEYRNALKKAFSSEKAGEENRHYQ